MRQTHPRLFSFPFQFPFQFEIVHSSLLIFWCFAREIKVTKIGDENPFVNYGLMTCSSKVLKLKLIKMETKPRVMLISVITYCLFVRSLTQAQNSYLTVKDGVYSKLTVAIRPSVPAKNCPQFLDNVEVRPAQFLLTFSDCNRKDRRR